MTSHRELLFLLGGSAAFDVTAEEFVPAAGGREAIISLLLQGGSKTGSEWEKYVPDYVAPWSRRGIARYYPIAPDVDGRLDEDVVLARLREATGIFIGGGHTPTYQRLYAAEPIRSVIREQYHRGVPVAGVSAGALIAPEHCLLALDETGESVPQKIVPGLGLVSGVVVGVHFTERNALPKVLDVMAQTRTSAGWGLDEPACAVFEGGRFTSALGSGVYQIVMTDFEAKTYWIEEVK